MAYRDIGPNLRRFGGVFALATALGVSACGGGDISVGASAQGVSREIDTESGRSDPIAVAAIIRAIAEGETAVIFSFTEQCPEVSGDENGVFQTPPTVEIAQVYVGDRNEQNERGELVNLHAAKVDTQYIVDGNVVYCGPDYGDNGSPYEGIMLVSESAPLLITAED